MTTPTRSRRFLPLLLIFGGILSFILCVIFLRRAFEVFDINVEFWVWFARACATFLTGCAGLHFGTQKLGLK
jgi:multidrug transporter EmrE-like cation transporter